LDPPRKRRKNSTSRRDACCEGEENGKLTERVKELLKMEQISKILIDHEQKEVEIEAMKKENERIKVDKEL
jgi:hypothetical protein